MIRYVKIKNKIIGFDTPKICVPLVGNTEEEILRQSEMFHKASKKSRVDIVEFRGDFFEGLGDFERLSQLLSTLKEKFQDIIFLFTIRSQAEGGNPLTFETPAINDINEFVIKNQLADLVDVELFSGADRITELVEAAKESGVKIIMSNHDFQTTPDAEVLVNRLRSMQDLGADIAKIAVMPENEMQVLSLLAATTTMNQKYAEIPIVTISMGKMGAISRVCGQVFGSAITFSTLEKSSAPGQIPVDELEKAMSIISRYCVEQ